MNEYGVLLEPGVIRFQRLLPGPIERVWSYLTDGRKRAIWLAHGELPGREGEPFNLFFHHADLSALPESPPEKYKDLAEGQTVPCRLVRSRPPRLLVWSWMEASGAESEVTFELAPQGDKILLTLTHRNLTTPEEIIGTSGGWHTHLGILADHLDGREPRPFWSTHMAYETEYEQRIAGKNRG
jgi:uncharacterized protein YndB with AHSA1/START domain